jgi:hypothetical protein
LAFWKPSQSPELENASNQRNQEELETNFSENIHNPRFKKRDHKKLKKELLKYDGKYHRGAIVWVNKMEGIFE